MMATRVAIIADDLTGTLDSAAPFADRGARVVAALHPAALDAALGSGAAVVAVNTLSRHLAPASAAAAVRQAAASCLAAGARFLFKKVDSRLRGNVGAETAALVEAVGAAHLVVAPAVPAQGRMVVAGRIHGAGVPDGGIDVARHVVLSGGCRVDVPDARTEADLDAAARTCRLAAVGAHGLAAALARVSHPDMAGGATFVAEPPILVVAGSQDPATAAQLAILPRNVAVVGAVGGAVPPAAPASRVVLRSLLDGTEGAEAALRFAAGAAAWCRTLRPRTLVATGGDTAAALLEHLGCRLVEVGGEVAPGIPWSRLPDGGTLVTKSGGFGGATFLADLLGTPHRKAGDDAT